MLQYSKLLNSRDEWKKKARIRNVEIREFRKTKKRHGQKIAELKQRNHELEGLVKNKKKDNA